MALVPLLLAATFGGLRVQGAMANTGGLRLAASRADVIPAITKYMSALDVALLASSTERDIEGAKKNFAARKYELQTRLANTDVTADVRSAANTLLNGGQALLDQVLANNIGLPERVTTYAPLLLTAENAITASVQVDSEQIRSQVQGLTRAVGARGQMTLQKILATRGAELPEPQLRTAMVTLAGTEPSTLFGMTEALGAGSPAAKMLQQQMVTRMAIMADPASALVGNPELLRSIEITQEIAEQIINEAVESVTKSVQSQAAARRDVAVREAALVVVVLAIAVAIVLLVARALIGPLRALRDGALRVAHSDLEEEIASVRAGAELVPEPLALYTTEEVGQVAHAVDELHTRAVLLAGDEARLRLLVSDMFETMARRSRSLVDQQLTLIDGLELDEADPGRLDSLFRLDHLAARLRRNSANLLVLAGAQITREHGEPVPLSTVISAAVSGVEDYRRVQIAGLPDCKVSGAVSGGLIHLLAELIDNALRYSPPATSVRVAAARGSEGGVLLRIADSGLGMTDGDRRMANMRLQAGGEFTGDLSPDSARHMGLFVVGRLAGRHGIRVGLRGPAAGETGTGTTAEVYLPLPVLEGTVPAQMPAQKPTQAPTSPPAQTPAPTPESRGQVLRVSPPHIEPDQAADPAQSAVTAAPAPGIPATLLPRRSPGSSGITDIPAEAAEQQQGRPRRELPTPWWENGFQQEPASSPAPAAQPAPAAAAPPASDTSAFFARRPPAPQRAAEPAPNDSGPPGPDDDEVIYRRMLSEMTSDPHELSKSTDLDWQTVWDRGWSAAAEAEDKPVESRTDRGLPVREPGARLIPGSVDELNEPDREGQGNPAASELRDGRDPDRQPQRPVAPRDPDAVRAAISSHFSGVQTARSHARQSSQEPDQQ